MTPNPLPSDEEFAAVIDKLPAESKDILFRLLDNRDYWRTVAGEQKTQRDLYFFENRRLMEHFHKIHGFVQDEYKKFWREPKP